MIPKNFLEPLEKKLTQFLPEKIDSARELIKQEKKSKLSMTGNKSQYVLTYKSNYFGNDTAKIIIYGSFVSSRCSCCYNNCVHCAALLLQALNENEPNAKFPITADIDYKVQKWLEQIENSANLPDEEENKYTSTPVQKKLIFSLQDLHLSSHKTIELKLAKVNKNGSLAKGAPTKVNLTELMTNPSEKQREHISEEDWKLLFETTRFLGAQDKIYLNGSEKAISMLEKFTATGRLFLDNQISEPIQWGKSRKAEFNWKPTSDGLHQSLVCEAIPEASLTFEMDGKPCYFDSKTNELGILATNQPPKIVQKLFSAPNVKVAQINFLGKELKKKSPKLKHIAPKELKTQKISGTPTVHLVIALGEVEIIDYDYRKEKIPNIIAALYFNYEGRKIPFLPSKTSKPLAETIFSSSKEIIHLENDVNFETKALKYLKNMDFISSDKITKKPSPDFEYSYYSTESANESILYFLEKLLPQFEEKKWIIEFDESFPIKEVVESTDWYVEAVDREDQINNDWFDVNLGMLIDGKRYNILPLLLRLYEQLNANPNFEMEELLNQPSFSILNTEDKKCIKISGERLYKIFQAFALEFASGSLDEKGNFSMSKWNSHLLAEMQLAKESTDMRWLGDSQLYDFGEKLRNVKSIEMVEPSKNMQSVLRPYQIEGLSWLQFLRTYKLNGILADDMGLGKTIQVLAHLQKEKDEGRIIKPCLVIAPTSLMFNWKNEIEKHTPSLSALILQGLRRSSEFDNLDKYDIVLTTYPLVSRDKDNLLKYQYHMIVLDEAQNIKNSRTQVYNVIQQLKSDHRLCITGTPMENHLGELWSLFNFLMPGFMGDIKLFQKLYRKPIEIQKDVKRQEMLTKRIDPFLLRRTKDLVAKELPEKIEIIQKIEMDKSQSDLYETIRIRAQAKVMKEVAEKGLSRSHITLLDALLKLRQVCCDPRLVKIEDDIIKSASSAKLEYLTEILPQLIQDGRRIIIFSQFTGMLSLIEEELKRLNIDYTTLTGSTIDRKTPVERFQNLEVPLMLISLKAGGVGLNLTSADTVIHYDPWWNPAVEQQATDRAHRIGQKKKVFVYKLVIQGSLEEKILAMQERKKELIHVLLGEKETKGFNISMEDLEDVFKPLSLVANK